VNAAGLVTSPRLRLGPEERGEGDHRTHRALAPLEGGLALFLYRQPCFLRVLDPQRAYAIGLVNEVVPAGQQVPVALKMAREMAEFSPLVLKTLKRFVTEAVLAQGPSEQSGRAQRALYEVKESEDAGEAGSAVKEKRKAVFKGR
jgi:1,4-dihydroxy-2-naphthoyl-CoA synthase